MYQTNPTKPLGRRRSISADRQAEVFRQHYEASTLKLLAEADRRMTERALEELKASTLAYDTDADPAAFVASSVEIVATEKPKRGRKAKAK